LVIVVRPSMENIAGYYKIISLRCQIGRADEKNSPAMGDLNFSANKFPLSPATVEASLDCLIGNSENSE
jgi:hypothetical protein